MEKVNVGRFENSRGQGCWAAFLEGQQQPLMGGFATKEDAEDWLAERFNKDGSKKNRGER